MLSIKFDVMEGGVFRWKPRILRPASGLEREP